MSQRIAVILFNLGGPDRIEDIQPYLKTFFMDKNIIQAPWILRFIFSRRIAFSRGRGEALRSYKRLGGKSPLLANTELQRVALERSLKQDYDGDIRCFISMRYWHPRADAVAQQVKAFAPDKIILLPLYPQYSTTTTLSAFEDWQRACRKTGLDLETVSIDSYACDDGFVGASADLITHALRKVPEGQKFRLLFSAHGLPEKIIKAGDPYQKQCEDSAKAIAEATGVKNLDWQICYQSRVGRLKWITPSTEDAIRQAAHDNVGIVIYPHAFVSEHVETLVEIEEDYRDLASGSGWRQGGDPQNKKGAPFFIRVPTVSTHPKFIVGLKNLIIRSLG